MVWTLLLVACTSHSGRPRAPADSAPNDTARDDTAPDDTLPDDSAPPDTASDDTARDDTGTEPLVEVDADGDGYPAWNTTLDARRADCDDTDPAVSPLTEVFVPAGAFLRGQEDVAWATPVRSISLSAYCIDRTEVTNAAFADLLQVREDLGYSNVDDEARDLYNLLDLDNGDPFPQRLLYSAGAWSVQEGYDQHPVVEVYHWGAEFFCASVGKALPTEAQWEKAARGAEDARKWPWGDDAPDCARANFVLTDPGETPQEGDACITDTAPIDTHFPGASPYQAQDLAGNAAEWVADWFDPESYASSSDRDPTGPETGTVFNDGVGEFVARIARGGGFLSAGETLQVSGRSPEPEGASSNGVGFRCARALVAGG